MLYWLWKWLMHGTIRIYFRKIRISGAEHLPSGGPVLVLANHPSMLMDAVVLAGVLPRRVSFMAKGVLFKHKVAAWLLPKFGMIPVHRVQDDPTQVGKNAGTFKKCFEHFEQGGAMLMFPEGISLTKRKLHPLKPGAAKLALAAQSKLEPDKDLKLLVIGLNYANQHKFNHDLFIRIQPVISLRAFLKTHDAAHGRTSDALTERIRVTLEDAMISVEDEETDLLVRDIEQFYKNHLLVKRGMVKLDAQTNLRITQHIVKAVQFYEATDPELLESMSDRIRQHARLLHALRLDHRYIAGSVAGLRMFRLLLQLVLGFPFYVYGLLNNLAAYWIPGLIANRMKDKDLRGSVGMLSGIFTFIGFYSIQSIVVQGVFHRWEFTLAYLLSLPFSGFFTYHYWHYFLHFKVVSRFLAVMKKRSDLIESLRVEHNSIISELDALRDDFLKKHPEIRL